MAIGFAVCFISVLIGVLLTPLDRLASLLIDIVATKLFPRHQLLTPSRMIEPTYVPLLAWLMSKQTAQLHSGCELYNFSVRWHIFTNVTLCAMLTLSRLAWPPPALDVLSHTAIVMLFLLFATSGSQVMAQVHDFYLKEFNNDEKRSTVLQSERRR